MPRTATGLHAFAAAIGAAVCAWLARRARRAVVPRCQFRRAIVGSSAVAKLDAARAALPGCTVVGFAAESQVRDQPIGLEETLRGARSRLTRVIESPDAAGADLAIAVENGIVCVRFGDNPTDNPTDEAWLDLALCVVRDLVSGKEGVSSSMGIALPPAEIAEWAESGAEGTFGAWLAAETGCDQQDPHSYLTRGQHPRKVLLQQAISAALARL